MVENVPLRVGACILCILVGFAFWPAFLLAGLIGFALIEELRDPVKPPPATRKSLGSGDKAENRESPKAIARPAAPKTIVSSRARKVDGSFSKSPRDKRQLGKVVSAETEHPPFDFSGMLNDIEQPLAVKTRPGSSEIRSLAEDLGIPHLVHFTRCDNLSSILRHGFLSIKDCKEHKIEAFCNDSMRLDAQPDGISLSVTFPNYRMFYKYRQLATDTDWAVLILSPKILWEKECAFYRCNAADSRMRNLPRELASTPKAFREMFEAKDSLRDHWLCAYDPTDPQAEVMVYEQIEPDLIETVAFETKADKEKWSSVLGGIETIYAGQGG